MKLYLYAIAILCAAISGCGGEEPQNTNKSTAEKKASGGNKASANTRTVRFYPVDLQTRANQRLEQPDHNDLSDLAIGPNQLAGIDFEVGRQYVQLASRAFPSFSKQVVGIPVGKRFEKLHVLHATQGGAFTRKGHAKHEEDGVEIGHYVLNYADGTTARLNIVYGVHARGWWNWDKSKPTPSATLAWTGSNPRAAKYGLKTRLYVAGWNNPHPDKAVTSIDFVSAYKKAGPMCVAMTLENAVVEVAPETAVAANLKPPSSLQPEISREPRNPGNGGVAEKTTPKKPGGLIPSKDQADPAPRVAKRDQKPRSIVKSKTTSPKSAKADPVPKKRDVGPSAPLPKTWTVDVDPPDKLPAVPKELPKTEFGVQDRNHLLAAAGPTRFLAVGKMARRKVTDDKRVSYDLHDLATGKTVGVARGVLYEKSVRSFGSVYQAMSSDGRYLAVLDAGKDEILVGDMKARKPVARFPYKEDSCVLSFPTPDRLLAVDRRHNVPAMLWELPSGRLIRSFPTGDKSTDKVRRHACSPGGRYLALSLGSPAESIQIFDLSTGKPAGTLLPETGNKSSDGHIYGMAFSPDGTEFAAFYFGVKIRAFTLGYAIGIWDVKTGRLKQALTPMTAAANRRDAYPLQFSVVGDAEPLQWFPDGRGWMLNHRHIIDRNSGRHVQRLVDAAGKQMTGVKIVDNERVVVHAADGNLRIVDVKRTWKPEAP